MAETVIIDIEARYRDQTKAGTQSTVSDMDRLAKKIKETESAGKKANASLEKIAQTAANIAKKAVTIPVKIIDYATKPLRSLISYATSLKGILTGIVMGQTAQKLFVSPTQYAETLKTHALAFENLLGSAEKANQMIANIQAFDEKSPFNTMQIIEQSRMLMTYKLANEKNVLSMIETIGDASMGVGAGDAGIERIVRALGQMKAKGKVSAEEMLQLSEVNIGGWQYLADAYGVSTAEIQKMTEKNKINVDDAINALIAGMAKDYGGMANTNASKTLSGLWGQISSVLENGPMLKWGQGLSEGAMLAATTASGWLEESKEAVNDLGDALYDLGKGASTYAAEKVIQFGDSVKAALNSREFQQADTIWKKLRVVWDQVIAEPFTEWWSAKGEKFIGDVAGKIGDGLGKFYKGTILTLLGIDTAGAAEGGISIGQKFAQGFLEGFDAEKVWEAVKTALGNGARSAAKLIPGGEKADVSSYLSAAILGYGGAKIAGTVAPLVSGVGGLVGSAGAAAASGTGILGLLGLGGTFGAVGGGGGLISAIADLNKTMKDGDSKAKNVAGWSAGSKLGLIGAGAALGSIIPGVGTLVGAGVGGVAALLGGGKLGQWLSDTFDGMKKINSAATGLNDTTSKLVEMTNKSRDVEILSEKIQELHRKIQNGGMDTEELAIAQSDLYTAINDLNSIYPNLISQYDLENDKLATKLSLIKDITQAEKDDARRKAEMAAYEAQQENPNIVSQLTAAMAEEEAHRAKYANEMAMAAELKEIELAMSKYQQTSDDMSWEEQDAAQQKIISEMIDPFNQKYGTNHYWAEIEGGSAYKLHSRNAYDSSEAIDETAARVAELMGTYQAMYNDMMTAAMLPADVDLETVSAKLAEIAKYESEIASLRSTMSGQEKGSDEYNETAQKIAEAETAQKRLKDEVERFKEPLMEVLKAIQDINLQFGLLGDKRLTLTDMGYGDIYNYLYPQNQSRKEGKGRNFVEAWAFASGTTSAPAGMAWVGENGPELIKLRGGERIYNAADSRRIAEETQRSTQGGATAAAPSVQVSLGGMNIQISGGDSTDIMEQLRERLPELGNELCAQIAVQLSRSYANMPTRVEGIAT